MVSRCFLDFSGNMFKRKENVKDMSKIGSNVLKKTSVASKSFSTDFSIVGQVSKKAVELGISGHGTCIVRLLHAMKCPCCNTVLSAPDG